MNTKEAQELQDYIERLGVSTETAKEAVKDYERWERSEGGNEDEEGRARPPG